MNFKLTKKDTSIDFEVSLFYCNFTFLQFYGNICRQ